MSSEEVEIKRKDRKPGQRFTIQEDKLILQLVNKVGPKFQKIHKSFPGKTLAMVKNRYYKYLRYRWELLGQEFAYLSTQDSIEQLTNEYKQSSLRLDKEKQSLMDLLESRMVQLKTTKMQIEYLINSLL